MILLDTCSPLPRAHLRHSHGGNAFGPRDRLGLQEFSHGDSALLACAQPVGRRWFGSARAALEPACLLFVPNGSGQSESPPVAHRGVGLKVCRYEGLSGQ